MRNSLFLLALALLAYSCARDVGPIDRTQHDKIEKRVFAGVWYMTQTVIDTPYNAAFTFVGETNFGQTGKVIFDIQEKMLVVYPVSEYVVGSEAKWRKEKIYKYWDDACLTKESEQYQCVDGKDNKADPSKPCCFIEVYVGQPLAAFEIVSHFDVQRQYNPQTGEQSNVLEENTTDRKWWQRRYIRVNWARNLIQDFSFMARLVNQQAVDYYVQTFETDNPDAPTITQDYIDVVTKTWGEPASSGACDIYGVSSGDCASALIKFRIAFRKVDPNNDYEPLRYHNEEHQKFFGYFLTERYAYDENYGLVESGRLSYINRWNIWQKTMDEQPVLDEQGKPKVCFKDLADSGCDTSNKNGNKEFCTAPDWFQWGTCVKRTPKPYIERGLRPIVYHQSANTPEEFYRVNLAVAKSWSEAFKDTVAWLYLWEEKGLIYGQAQSKECLSDADCAPHALLDTWVELDQVKDRWQLPFVISATTCSRNEDCASGMCDNGKCRNIKFSQLSKTVIADGTKSGVEIVDFQLPTVTGDKCVVRLVNLNQDAADLVVNGSAVLTNQPKTVTTLDPANPPYATVPAGTGLEVEVVANGQKVASLSNFACKKDEVTLFVLKGQNLWKSTATTLNIKGLRVFNATDKALDIVVAGGLRFKNLQPGTSTGYLSVAGGSSGTWLPADFVSQRVVGVPTGTNGDVTCFFTEPFSGESKGRCVGYKPDVDWDRWQQIRDKLPEMFVLCRNQYEPQYDDQFKSKYYAPWVQVRDSDGSDLPERNPCVDFIFNAQKMSDDEKLAQAKAMKKAGDSRYSMIYFIPDAQIASPLGYGPSAADPDTGEIFWGTANIYGAYIYYYAALYRDLFDLVNGKLPTDYYVTGQAIRDYLAAQSQHNAYIKSSEALSGQTEFQVDEALLRQLTGGKRVTWHEILNVLKDKDLRDKLMKMNVPVKDPSVGLQRLTAIKGTPFEDMLINDEIKLAASAGALKPGDGYREKDKENLSPLNWATMKDMIKKERDRQILLSSHNYCFADFSDEGLLGQAKSWACQENDTRPECGDDWDVLDHANDYGSKCCFKDGQKLAKVIMLRFYKAVTEHEVGHTVGLRHNFEASSDLFNYHDEYFDVREKEPVPCVVDDECDIEQVCVGGYCHWARPATCTNRSQCGPADMWDCVQGVCVELKKCGLHGECGAGEICNGDEWLCYKDGKRVEKPVDPNADTTVYQMIPRPGLTENEALRSRTIFQYSSIMDYGQRFNSDVLGIGKYDKAAIRFGYGQLIDVYEDTSELMRNIYRYARAYGYSEENMSDMLDTSYWSWGVYFSQLYFLQNYIGVDQNRSERITLPDGTVRDFSRNRAAMPYERVKLEQQMTTNYYRVNRDWTYVTVPYKFCGDEYRGNMGCYTWDTGMDPVEIMHNFRIALTEYYLVDAFKRERFGFGLHGNPMAYFSRILSRYLDPLQDGAMYYALFAHILKGYGWRALWANGRLMGWSLRRASEEAFETLANLLMSPLPGSFKYDATTNTYKNISYEPNVEGSELNIRLGDGKYPYTRFMDQAGYNYFDHAIWIGSFWEKLGSIMTLTDSTVYFTTNYVGEQLNIGVGTSLGFNTMYPRQLIDLFGGLVASDRTKAGWVVQDGKAQWRRYFDPANMSAYSTNPPAYSTPYEPDSTLPRIEPSLDNITMKLYAMVYGMAFLPASFDPSFLDAFRVCFEGSGTCYNLASSANVPVASFTDPFGGKTYVAFGTNYGPGWFQPNVELINKANALKQRWENASGDEKVSLENELREVIKVLDLMRGLWDIYGAMRI
jgi:hypothetical protein